MVRRGQQADEAPVRGVVQSRGVAFRDGRQKKRPLAHPPEPGYPCCVSALGELAWMAPREEPPSSVPAVRPFGTGAPPVDCPPAPRGVTRRIRLVAYGARLESVLV